MESKAFRCTIQGIVPLLQHNPILSDPLSKPTQQFKAISQKRSKTDADHAELSRVEFLYSLYLKDGKPCIPAEWLEAAMIGAAKKFKRGMDAKAGIFVDQHFPLIYEGPTDPKEMWEDGRFVFRTGVKQSGSRVYKTRAIFNDWKSEIEINYLTSIFNERDIKEFLAKAGAVVGIGAWRPKFGRFFIA
jgi:hypothetical protein